MTNRRNRPVRRHTHLVAALMPFILVAITLPLRAQSDPTLLNHDTAYSFPARERVEDYLSRSIGPEAMLNSALLAGLDQARDNPEGWEQGGSGYGKRFASRLGRRAIGNTIQLGVEAALQEDSRYTPLGQGRLTVRLTHSLSHTFMARTPAGRRIPSIGRWAGIVGGSLLSRRWYPAGENSIADGSRAAAISFGTYAGMNVLREFLPDIKRIFRK